MDEYDTLERLQIRQNVHLLHSDPPDNVEESTLSVAPVPAGSAVLDVGCGTASFLVRLAGAHQANRLVGLDLSSAAVITAASKGFDAVQADVCAMPFSCGIFDAVYARHMLYHARDVRGAIRECKRVLAPGGRFIAVVNHPQQAPNLSELMADVMIANEINVPKQTTVDSECLPDEICQQFGNVATSHIYGTLVFSEPWSLTEFAISLLSFYGVSADSPVYRHICHQLGKRIEAQFRKIGDQWRDAKGYAIIVATK